MANRNNFNLVGLQLDEDRQPPKPPASQAPANNDPELAALREKVSATLRNRGSATDAGLTLDEPETPDPLADVRESVAQTMRRRKERETMNPVADLTYTAAAGANDLVRGIGWLFDSDTLQRIGARGAEYWENKISEGMKSAAAKQFITDDFEIGEGASDPYTWASVVARSLPSMVPGIGGAKVASAGAKVAGASAKTAATAGAVGGTATEGAVIGGMVGDETYRAVMNAPESQLRQAPLYQTLIQTMEPDEARKKVAEKASEAAALPAGVMGALLGYSFNKFVGDAVTGRLSARIGKEGAKGAGLESATELSQGAAESYFRQSALEDYAARPFSTSELANEAVTGAAAGGVMGGAVGAAGGASSDPAQQEDTPDPDRPMEEFADPDLQGGPDDLGVEPPVTDDQQGAPPEIRAEGLTVDASNQQPFPGMTEATEGVNAASLDVPEQPVPQQGLQTEQTGDSTAPKRLRSGGPADALQNRDRSRQAMRAQVEQIANTPDYDQVSVSRDATTGAPMVFGRGDYEPVPQADRGRTERVTISDGKGGTRKITAQYAVVEGDQVKASHDITGKPREDYGTEGLNALNNGRMIGLTEAQRRGKATGYTNDMMADAEAHGVDPDAIAGKENPVLVRIFDESELEGIENPGAASNTNFGADLSASEQAASDAQLIDGAMLDQIQPGDVDQEANRDFVRAFINALGTGQANEMLTADGNLTSQGVTRLEGALVARAYDDQTLLKDLTENKDDDLRTLGDALIQVSGRWAKMRDLAAEGVINPEVDVTESLVKVINMIRTKRQRGVSLADQAAQVDAFAGPVEQHAIEILGLLHKREGFKNIRPRDEIVAILSSYAEQAMQTSPEPDLMGDMTGPNELLEAQRGQEPGQPETPQAGLNIEPEPAPAQGDGDSGGSGEAEGAGVERPEAEPAGGTDGAEVPAEEGATGGLTLESYSEQDLQQQEQDRKRKEEEDAKRKAEEEARAKADDEADDFVLTGSDRPADVAGARGQTDFLIDPNSGQDLDETPPDPKPEQKDETPSTEGVSRSGDQKMPETVSAGPMSAKVTPIGGKLYRETSPERLGELLQQIYSNNPERGAVTQLDVTNDRDLAIGQGDNKGVMVELDGDWVSGQENEKPGTGIVGGVEFTTNYIHRNAITRFVLPKGARFKGSARVFANRHFDKRQLDDGRTEYVAKGKSDNKGVSVRFSEKPTKGGSDTYTILIDGEPILSAGVFKAPEGSAKQTQLSILSAATSAEAYTKENLKTALERLVQLASDKGYDHIGMTPGSLEAMGEVAGDEQIWKGLGFKRPTRNAQWELWIDQGKDREPAKPATEKTIESIADTYERRIKQGKEPRVAQWLEGKNKTLSIKRLSTRELGKGNVGYAVYDEDGKRLTTTQVYRTSEKGANKAARQDAVDAKAALEMLRSRKVQTPKEAVEQAAKEAETRPTDAQIEAGNYKKGHVRLHGLEIAIENPRGSTRRGTDPDGTAWESKLAHHYGYIKGTEGNDGDHLDVFIGPKPESTSVYVVDQYNDQGAFDEHKVMLGFSSKKAAEKGYRDNYPAGWKVGPITKLDIETFTDWVANGDLSRPVEDTERNTEIVLGWLAKLRRDGAKTILDIPDSGTIDGIRITKEPGTELRVEGAAETVNGINLWVEAGRKAGLDDEPVGPTQPLEDEPAASGDVVDQLTSASDEDLDALFDELEGANTEPEPEVEPETTYMERWRDRRDRLIQATTEAEIDAVLAEEMADDQRDPEGTQVLNIEAQTERDRIQRERDEAKQTKARAKGRRTFPKKDSFTWESSDGVIIKKRDDGQGYDIFESENDRVRGNVWSTQPNLIEARGMAQQIETVEAAKQRKPEGESRTASDIAKSLGGNVSSAGANAIKGLEELFGGKGRMGSGLAFDEDTYAKAKPYFKALLKDVQAAGKDLRDFIQLVLDNFGPGVRPYVKQFAKDLRDGQIRLDDPEVSTEGWSSPEMGERVTEGVKKAVEYNESRPEGAGPPSRREEGSVPVGGIFWTMTPEGQRLEQMGKDLPRQNPNPTEDPIVIPDELEAATLIMFEADYRRIDERFKLKAGTERRKLADAIAAAPKRLEVYGENQWGTDNIIKFGGEFDRLAVSVDRLPDWSGATIVDTETAEPVARTIGIEPTIRKLSDLHLRLRNGQDITQTEQESDDVSGPREGVERDSDEPEAGDALGGSDVPTVAGGAGTGARGSDQQAGGSRSQSQGGQSVPDGGAAAAGERGDQPVHNEQGEIAAASGAAGSADTRGRSQPDGAGASPDAQGSRRAPDPAAEAESLSKQQRVEAQKAAERIEPKAADLDNIRETLPVLLPLQQEDVHFIEQRLLTNAGHGVLIGNGTGTGKTFTALGSMKRYDRMGRGSQLVVVPNDKVASDWVESGKLLGLDIKRLKDTKDNGGDGIAITTYANFRQNASLVQRQWDLLLFDEAHYLRQKDDFSTTQAEDMRNALTGHPRGRYHYHRMLHAEEYADLEQKRNRIRDLNRFMNLDDAMDQSIAQWQAEADQLQADVDKIQAKLDKAKEREEAEAAKRWDENATDTVMLSATPFPYRKSVDMAAGYLFDYGTTDADKEGRVTRYNEGDAREQFFISRFGYRLRYNKLNEPDAEVDTDLMEREFTDWLMREGAMRARTLEVEKDYDRRFYEVEDQVGAKIDDGLQWILNESDKYRDQNEDFSAALLQLHEYIAGQFDYLKRAYFLEAVKAKRIMPTVKKHLALGRKVVIFHDYNKGGSKNPLKLPELDAPPKKIRPDMSDTVKAQIEQQNEAKKAYQHFKQSRPDLMKLDLSDLVAPRERFADEFVDDALFFSGKDSKKVRRQNVELFNQDDSGKDLIVVQSDAGREGVSMHDTTGNRQRVLINLGLPVKPIASIQTEGRIYRTFVQSNAIQRYVSTGLAMERWAIASKLAERSGTAENLAMGSQARGLKQSFLEAYELADQWEPGHEGEGTGGKERDKALMKPLTDWERAITYYFGTAKNTKRRDQREGKDYFATPEPLGVKMVEWADLRPGDSALEPSAGHGAILRWFPESITAQYVEQSSELGSKAAMKAPEAEFRGRNFEDLALQNKYEAVVMNPPFGQGGKLAWEHFAKAKRHLREGGRIVALMPVGPAANKREQAFWESDKAKGLYPVASFTLPRVTFERAGTNIPAKVIIADYLPNAEQAPDPKRLYEIEAETIKDFFDQIRDLEVPGRTVAEPEPTYEPQAGFETAETVHAKKGIDLFVAKLTERVDRDTFVQLRDLAKAHGGYYSSFARNGAIPGFQFESDSDRADFLAEANRIMGGDSVSEPGITYEGEEAGTPIYTVREDQLGFEFEFAPDERETGDIQGREGDQDRTDQAAAAGRRQAPILNQALRTRQRETQSIRYGVERVTSPAEAAHVLAPFRKESQETMLALVLDRDQKPLGIIRHTKGLIDSAPVDSGRLVGDVLSIPGARSVWMSHNHPSGVLDPSQADLDITRVVSDLARQTGIEVKGHVLLGFGREYGEFDGDGLRDRGNIEAAPRRASLPVLERKIQSLDKRTMPTVKMPQDAKRAIEEVAGMDKTGFLLMDNRHKAVGFLDITGLYDYTQLRDTRLPSDFLQAVVETNAAAVIPHIGHAEGWGAESSQAFDAVENLGGMVQSLSSRQIRVLDMLTTESGGRSGKRLKTKSWAQEGVFPGDHFLRMKDGRYQQGADRAEVQARINALTANWDGAPVIDTVQSESDLPAPLRYQIEAQGATGQTKGVLWNNRVWIVADNVTSRADLEQTILHEVVGHYGVFQILGNDAKPIMNRIFYANGGKRRAQAIINAYFPDGSFDPGNEQHRFIVSAELIAHMAEDNKHYSLVSRLAAAIQDFLRKLGFQIEMNAVDLQKLLRRSHDVVANAGIYSPGKMADAMLNRGDRDLPDLPEVEELTDEEAERYFGAGFRDRAGRGSGKRDDADRSLGGGRPRSLSWRQATRLKRKTRSGSTEPVRVWRGSAQPLTRDDFRPDRLGKASGNPNASLGVWFTTNRDEASQYGNPEPFYLDLRKPKVYTAETTPQFTSQAQARLHARKLQQQGYDGIVFDYREEGLRLHAVAFEPDQVIEAANPDDQALFRLEGDNQASPAQRKQAKFWEGFLQQPVDRLFRALFDATGQVDSHGRWRGGVVADQKVRNAIVNARPNPKGKFGWMDHYLETARAGLIDRYGLSDEYKMVSREAEAYERRKLTQAMDLLQMLDNKNVGAAEARVLQDILNGERVDDNDLKDVAVPIRRAIDDLGREAVKLGLISEAAYQKNKGTYLHRSYLKHEERFSSLSKWVAELGARKRRKIYGDAAKRRGMDWKVKQSKLVKHLPRDWFGWKEDGKADLKALNKQEFIILENPGVIPASGQLDGMGEGGQRQRTREVIYWPADRPIPARYEMYRNKGRWQIRATRGDTVTLHRDYTKEERMKMGEILDARYNIAKTFETLSHDLAMGKFFRDIADNKEWFSREQPEGEVIPAGDAAKASLSELNRADWVEVPKSAIEKAGGAKKWGALAGGYVRAEIWRDLNELDKMHNMRGFFGFWREILTQWKLNKTARSPVVHTNNIMSNFVLMDMADVRATDLVRGIVSYVKKDSHFKDAQEHGAFEGTFVNEEIRQQVLRPLLDEMLKEQTTHAKGPNALLNILNQLRLGLVRKVKWADDKMTNFYQIEDELFRMATYMRRLDLGDTAQEAALMAREQFLDYDIRAPWINSLRRTVLPFIAYTYRAVPVVAQALMHRPWKFAKYVTIAHMVNAMGYYFEPGDEDEERRTMRPEMQGQTWFGTPRLIRLPDRDQYGNPMFIDTRRWIPIGDVFDMNQGQSALPIIAPLQFGGPIMLGFEFFLNKQAFTGDPITLETDTGWEKLQKVGEWAYKSWMPSAAYIPGSYYWDKTVRAYQGGRDILGRPYSVPQSLLSSFGIKAQPHDVQLGYFYRSNEINRQRREIMQQMRRLQYDLQRDLIDQKDYREGAELVRDKMKRLREEYRKLRGN